MASELLKFEFRYKDIPTIKLSPESASLPVTQLQISLPSGISQHDSVGDALLAFQSCRTESEVGHAIKCLATASRPNGSINWYYYWGLLKYRFQYLRLRCEELDRLSAAHPDFPINRETFGKAGITLSKNGINTLQILVDRLSIGLPSLYGFGKSKEQEFFSILVSLIQRSELGVLSSRIDADQDTGNLNNSISLISISHPEFDSLNSKFRDLPLTAVHLSYKSQALAGEGITTLGDLIETSKKGFPSIRGVGKGTFEKIKFILSALSKSLDKDGGIDSKEFCKNADVPLIPSGAPPKTGKEFVKALPSFCDQFVSATNDERNKVIFADRVLQRRAEQKTLEQLAVQFGITRERVRQLESNALQLLSDALLYDEYPNLEYRISSEFSKFFKQAAIAFQDEGENIFLERFMIKLKDTWNTPVEDIRPQMALITAVLTQTAVKPSELQIDRTVPVQFWENVPTIVSEKPLRQLALGKGIADFENEDIHTLGEAIDALLTKQLRVSEHRNSVQTLKMILKDAANTLSESNSNSEESHFWLRYAENSGLMILPDRELDGPAEFLNSVAETAREVVRLNGKSKYGMKVFELRTSKALRERFTLEKTAESIQIFASYVKKIETDFVTVLNSNFIDQDFTDSKVFFRKSFLDYWQQANSIYDDNRDFSRFKFNLARKWMIDQKSLDQNIDLIWTVLNIYPNGRNIMVSRRRRGVRSRSGTGESLSVGVIKLRGFRRVY